MTRQNCWEAKKCGRGPAEVSDLSSDICPAALETVLDNVHGGLNAGRACWVVAGTMCQGERQGTFAKKYRDCMDCDFYQNVMREEGLSYMPPLTLLDILKVKKGTNM